MLIIILPRTAPIKRKETVALVIAMKESSFLLAVDRIVGGIEIECDFLRWFIVRIEKLIHQHLLQFDEGLSIDSILEPTKRRR